MKWDVFLWTETDWIASHLYQMSVRNKIVSLSVTCMYVYAALICNICIGFYGLQGFFMSFVWFYFITAPWSWYWYSPHSTAEDTEVLLGKSLPTGHELVNGRAGLAPVSRVQFQSVRTGIQSCQRSLYLGLKHCIIRERLIIWIVCIYSKMVKVWNILEPRDGARGTVIRMYSALLLLLIEL